MTNDFFNDAVWEKAWKEDPDTAVSKMKKAEIDPAHTFDHRAESFNEQAFNEEGRRRTKRIMNWLEGQGVTFKDTSILALEQRQVDLQCRLRREGPVLLLWSLLFH